MRTLVLKFSGPMQSWSVDSKFSTRSAGRWPSRSAIIGMLSAALGLERGENLDRFKTLRIVIRIDSPGEILPDYHSIRKWDRSEGVSEPIGNALAVSNRYYFEDAVFMVFLQDEDNVIDDYKNALRQPKYSLFFGRKSCPTTIDLIYGSYDSAIEDIIDTVPIQHVNIDEDYTPVIVRDAVDGEVGSIIKDVPIDYSVRNRRYSGRLVVEESMLKSKGQDEDIFGFIDSTNGEE